MLKHLLSQYINLKNSERQEKLKNTEFPWISDKDVAIYFSKIEKDQSKLKKMDVIWDNTQKVTQAVDEVYNIDMFDEKQLME